MNGYVVDITKSDFRKDDKSEIINCYVGYKPEFITSVLWESSVLD